MNDPRHNWTDAEWLTFIRDTQGTAVEAIVETGRRIKAAHDAYRVNPELWGGKKWEAWCRKELGYTKGAISALETVGEFGNAKLFRHALPADATSLYYLAKWDKAYPGELEAAVEKGQVFAGMDRKQVKEICGASARAVRDQRNAAIEVELAGGDWKLEQGDFRSWKISDVDLVLTDPPYADQHLDLYEDLPVHAADWLKPDGWLGVMVGQAHLPKVLAALTSGPLDYAWTFCLKSSASRAHGIQFLRVQSMWKPMVLLRKRGSKVKLREWTLDHIDYEWQAKDGDHHRWQQDVSPFQKLIRAMTDNGATVADPFCGSGTTGVAAISTSRHFLGCDEDPLSIKAASARLKQAEMNAKLPDDVAAIKRA